MQDFAKTRPIAGRELAPPVDEWRLDAGSVLFGVLLGAIVAFAGLNEAY
jgi:surfactin synthase thioesterase subunit